MVTHLEGGGPHRRVLLEQALLARAAQVAGENMTSDSSLCPSGGGSSSGCKPSGLSTVRSPDPSQRRGPATSVRRHAPDRSTARKVSSVPVTPAAVLPECRDGEKG